MRKFLLSHTHHVTVCDDQERCVNALHNRVDYVSIHYNLKDSTYLLGGNIEKAHHTASTSVLTALKDAFSRLGIPSVFVSDNEPQFTTSPMDVMSSPHYPQAHGCYEQSSLSSAHGCYEQSSLSSAHGCYEQSSLSSGPWML